MANINDSFFDGHYKDIWRAIIPAQLTSKEVRFMIDFFKLEKGDQVLDMMCGYGRHSLALAAEGIQVTAVDNLASYTREIQEEASRLHYPISTLQKNVLEYVPSPIFKLVICMGNSLNFFNAGDTATLLQNWAKALKPGGYILINSWSLAETVIPNFAERSEASHAGVNIASISQYLFHPARIETETSMTAADGTTEVKTAIDYIFSVNEMEELLTGAGFSLEEIYDIPGKKKYSLGASRAYIIGRKK